MLLFLAIIAFIVLIFTGVVLFFRGWKAALVTFVAISLMLIMLLSFLIMNRRAKSLYLTGAEELHWMSEPLAEPGPHDVLLQTHRGAISIGSELPIYRGTDRSSKETYYPRMTGYENVGIILACGSQVAHLRPGDRVVASYGHRTHSIVPASRVIPTPDDISDELALLAILTCDMAKGVRKVAPRPEEAVLVTGAGAIGLLTLFILKAYGVSSVDITEPDLTRHQLSLTLGARRVLHPSELPDSSQIYAVAFECSSRNAAFTFIQRHMQIEGRICILSDGNYEPLTLDPAFHEKELQIVGSSDGWGYQKHALWYFNYLQTHPTDLARIFDLHIRADELLPTFAQLADSTIRPIKILVRYDEY